MELRTSFSTKAWNGAPPGTSEKSANQPLARVPLAGPGTVTVTGYTPPGASAGTSTVICVAPLTTTPDAATPPTVTVAPAANLSPPRIAPAIPLAGPDDGEIELTTTP